MSFRRIPFQFSSIDPVERQAELEKRFGLPANKMYVDVANPFSTGAAGNGSTSSPRLQHRVPIFLDGQEHPIQSSIEPVDQSSCTKKAPNVRVIPIEVEGDYRPSSRRRNLSGPAGASKAPQTPPKEECLKRSVEDLSQPTKVQLNGDAPKVHRIPIQIEGRDFPPTKTLKSSKKQEHPDGISIKSAKPKAGNGCASSKQVSTVEPAKKVAEQKPEPVVENPVESSLKKIEDVLKELESYEKGVNEFGGTVKDKQYRYLDEMLTRCMLRLDNVDTLGNNDIRTARKNAVRKVQACIDLLESKVRSEQPQSSEQSAMQTTDVEMTESSEASQAEHNGSDGQQEVPMAEVQSCTEDQSEVLMTENQSSLDEEQSEVVMAELPNNDGHPEVQMSEAPGSDSTCEETVSVTELEPDFEDCTKEPSVVEPAEIGTSEDQQERGVKHSDESSGENAVIIEEVSDEAVGDIPEVTMAEVDSESLPIVEEAGSPVLEEAREGTAVEEVNESEMSEANVESHQTSAGEKTVTVSEMLQIQEKCVQDSTPVTEL